MKILFIGGTGTISMAITRLLAQQGHELYLLNRGNRAEAVPAGVRLELDRRADRRVGVYTRRLSVRLRDGKRRWVLRGRRVVGRHPRALVCRPERGELHESGERWLQLGLDAVVEVVPVCPALALEKQDHLGLTQCTYPNRGSSRAVLA